jgi:prepilin-type N-terminal cleavage/methylation domain-containing protein
MKSIRKELVTSRGFSLIEIAIVLVIISVLLTIVVVPLSTQVEQRRRAETEKQLELIKEAIIGFALANGRFPCASRATDNGVESFIDKSAGTCNAYVGFLPAVTLGISPIDSSGFAVDSWEVTPNRIRYAVADFLPGAPPPLPCPSAGLHVLTRTDGMKAATMGCLADTTVPALNMLTVCAVKPTGAPGAASACTSPLSVKAPFVLLSLGKNAPVGGIGADEAHNVDADSYFVTHTPTDAGSTSGEFDDIVAWPSLNTIFGRMVQAGKLP